MWGPDPPTAKAITNRLSVLRASSRERGVALNSGTGSKKTSGLVTPKSSPKSSPKTPAKRVIESNESREKPQRPCKRRAAQAIKNYCPFKNSDSDDESTGFKNTKKEIDSDEESDAEWKAKEGSAENDLEVASGFDQNDLVMKTGTGGLEVVEERKLGAPFEVAIYL